MLFQVYNNLSELWPQARPTAFLGWESQGTYPWVSPDSSHKVNTQGGSFSSES